MTGHVVLLGDSILDNRAYVSDHPDVVAQLQAVLPRGWTATLLAVDGDVTGGVARQLRGLPSGATHLVVSAGGNDALGFSAVLGERPDSVAGALTLLATALDLEPSAQGGAKIAAAVAALVMEPGRQRSVVEVGAAR